MGACPSKTANEASLERRVSELNAALAAATARAADAHDPELDEATSRASAQRDEIRRLETDLRGCKADLETASREYNAVRERADQERENLKNTRLAVAHGFPIEELDHAPAEPGDNTVLVFTFQHETPSAKVRDACASLIRGSAEHTNISVYRRGGRSYQVLTQLSERVLQDAAKNDELRKIMCGAQRFRPLGGPCTLDTYNDVLAFVQNVGLAIGEQRGVYAFSYLKEGDPRSTGVCREIYMIALNNLRKRAGAKRTRSEGANNAMYSGVSVDDAADDKRAVRDIYNARTGVVMTR